MWWCCRSGGRGSGARLYRRLVPGSWTATAAVTNRLQDAILPHIGTIICAMGIASHRVAEIGLTGWKVRLIEAGAGADRLAWAAVK
jgi:hypothetical protein